MLNKASIAIAVITFKRPQSLAATLESLRKITLPPYVSVKLLVIDNDAGKSAASVVDELKNNFSFPVVYLIEEKQGIPYARNKALKNAMRDDYIAFIDDDDTVAPGWLSALYAAVGTYNADVVKGRVLYTFPQGKEYLSHIDIFADIPVATGTELASAWTNNVLFAVALPRQTGLRFDTAFVHSGGSDHHFFRCAKSAGAKIVMCKEAIVHTHVPLKRTTWRWLMRRNLRVGATLTISDIRAHGFGYGIRQACRSFADSFRYCMRLLPGVSTGDNRFIHPAMVFFFALGRISGIFHVSPAEYRI